MVNSYTILHISDIHKPNGADYNNLFTSLYNDCESYVNDKNNPIGNPSIIVVSGDLIEGSNADDADVAENEINQQYAEVEDFLNNLANYFLDGDKKRMIIVPGNHDVNRNVAKASMKLSDNEKTDDVYEYFNDEKTDLRWSWKDFNFYRVVDKGKYKRRFDNFVRFYNRFYSGLRNWENPCEEKGIMIDLPEYNITFVGFNSCYALDNLGCSGKILSSVISNVNIEINKLYKQGRLIVGVWHHNTFGLPNQNDYLDYRDLKSMMSMKMHLGMFGHMHRSDVLNEYKDYRQDTHMLLVSAGTLYGDKENLLSGCPRQYNLLELKMNGNTCEITINVREDSLNSDIPNWHESIIRYSTKVDLYLPPLIDSISIIEDQIHSSGDYLQGCKSLIELLTRYNSNEDRNIINSYIDNFINEISDDKELISLNLEPQSERQAFRLLEAATQCRKTNLIKSYLELSYIKDKINDPLHSDVINDALKIIK